LPRVDWTATDQNLHRQALLGTMNSTALDGFDSARQARHRLALAIANRETAFLHKAAMYENVDSNLSSNDRLRLILATATFGVADAKQLSDGLMSDFTDVMSLKAQAAIALMKGGRCIRAGHVSFLEGQRIPIVKGTINGRHTGFFIVDTGAPHCALSRHWCQESDLTFEQTVKHQIDDGAGRTIEAAAVRLDHLLIGAESTDVPAVVFDFPAGLNVAGILSPLDAFAEMPVIIDNYQKRLVICERTPELSFDTRLYWREGVPLVHALLDGHSSFMMIDSGAGGEVICEHTARRLGYLSSKTTTTISASGPLKIGLGAKVEITVGREPPRKLDVATKPCRDRPPLVALLQLDGLLGCRWMSNKVVAFHADRLHVSYSESD
jgi:Aspartyl protease